MSLQSQNVYGPVWLQTSFVLFVCLLLSAFSFAEAMPLEKNARGWKTSHTLPEKYGQVIYNKNRQDNKRVYIIFQAHRSPVTGMNGEYTVQTQADIYRIQEWIIRNKDVQLLCPEGFFENKEKDEPREKANTISITPVEDHDLREHLSDTSQFMNADRLLSQNSNIRLKQIEDRDLYSRVSGYIAGGKKQSHVQDEGGESIVQLQKKRSALLLQKLPTLIEEAYQAGRIDSHQAIFTIGFAHAPEILQFLQEERISSRFVDQRADSKGRRLNLTAKGYSVSLIMPRTLLQISDKLALNLAGLE